MRCQDLFHVPVAEDLPRFYRSKRMPEANADPVAADLLLIMPGCHLKRSPLRGHRRALDSGNAQIRGRRRGCPPPPLNFSFRGGG